MTVDGFIRQFRAWEPFSAATSSLPTSAPGRAPDKGKVFERLTQPYARTAPEYQAKLKNVWLAKTEVPSAVRAKLRLPPGDEGIDLVAEARDGDFWAIQCKFPDEHKPRPHGRRATDVRQAELQRAAATPLPWSLTPLRGSSAAKATAEYGRYQARVCLFS